MSQITRCPSCLTSFQVTQSQLAQASGWVRCGRCDQIFDGAMYMIDGADDDAPILEPTPADAGGARAQQAQGDEPAAAIDPATAGSGPNPPSPNLGLLTPARPASAPAFAEPVMALPDPTDLLDHIRPTAAGDDGPMEPTLDPVEEPGEPEPSSGSGNLVDSDAVGPDAADSDVADQEAMAPPEEAQPGPGTQLATPADAPQQASDPAPIPPALPTLGSEPTLADADADAEEPAPLLQDVRPGAFQATPADHAEPSFVARARRRAFWNHGLVRTGLWLLTLLLGVALGGQWVLHERDRLAAEHPQWAPALNALCQTMGCTVAPYRKLDALAITSSSLKRLNDDAFELDVSLRNRAAVAVAVPALELTLTDLSERILVRRVLRPAELDAPERLAAHGQWRSQRALVLDPQAGVSGVVNYKLQMFYP